MIQGTFTILSETSAKELHEFHSAALFLANFFEGIQKL